MPDLTYREAAAVLLHDQRVIIAKDPYSQATDASWTMADSPEYSLNHHGIQALVQVLDALDLPSRHANDNPIGVNRAYTEYRPSGLEKVEVLETANGRLQIRIYVCGKTEEHRWLEEWSYSGAYTVMWLAQDYPRSDVAEDEQRPV